MSCPLGRRPMPTRTIMLKALQLVKKASQASSKKFKSMISALETKQNKVLEAVADAHQAGISAILGSTSPLVAQIAGAAVPTHSKDGLLKHAQVAAHKFQGILKARKKT